MEMDSDKIIQRKRDAPKYRSYSTKVSALSMLKSGLTQRKVSERLGIPMRTLRDWKAAAIKAGTWNAGGDAGLARPAPRPLLQTPLQWPHAACSPSAETRVAACTW